MKHQIGGYLPAVNFFRFYKQFKTFLQKKQKTKNKKKNVKIFIPDILLNRYFKNILLN